MMTATELIDLYLKEKDKEKTEIVDPVKPVKPRRKSLAQKQGYRKASRTKQRKSYIENKGFLYHFYYTQDPKDNV